MMKRNLIPNVVLVLISILLAFGIGELGARYPVKAPPFEEPMLQLDYLTAKDVNLRWRFSAQRGRNSLGLRNREIIPKGKDQRRILFLGDSLIWTGGTSSGYLYTELIERRLNAVKAQSAEIQVINAGVPGYTTYQELEFLKAYGDEMQPDFLVLGFVLNDVYFKYLHKPTASSFLSTEPTVYLERFDTRSFPANLLANSYLAHLALYDGERIWKRLNHQPSFPFEQRVDFYLAWKPYGWANTRPLLAEMQAWAKQRGIPFIVIIFPVSDQVNDQYRKLDENYVLYPQSRIKGLCDELGIPYLDETDTIYTHGGMTLYQDYLHFNAKGNDLIADTLTEYLQEKRLLWLK